MLSLVSYILLHEYLNTQIKHRYKKFSYLNCDIKDINKACD